MASSRFRRSIRSAIEQARSYVEKGFTHVVDIDLAKFFDRVNHDRLLSRLTQRIADKRVLRLIRAFLTSGILVGDLIEEPGEGTPQGGPLSPLLSNIVLDELDQELEERGHRFVRYADDSNIYVRSERAGQRVMASITAFIEKRLRLKVNASKSAVARPEERHFLGFRLKREPKDGSVEVLLSKRSDERIDRRIRELTPRNWGQSLRRCIEGLNEYLVGWVGFFAICTTGVQFTLETLDKRIRRRLRAILLAHWKTKRTIVRKLIRLGVKPKTAWRITYAGRQSRWAMSRNPAMHQGLRNAYFAERGLVSVTEQWRHLARYIGAPGQQQCLALG